MATYKPNNQEAPTWRRTGWFVVAELVAIIFGVFLGSWASDLQQEREVSDFVARSRAVILRELEGNFESINKARAYHLELLPQLVEARDAVRAAEPAERVPYRGLGVPLVTTASYETALSAGTFARVDPEEATSIAYAYEQILNMRSVMENYRLALATSEREFFALTSTAFGDSLYAEDAALEAIAPLVGQEPPPKWTEVLSVWPY